MKKILAIALVLMLLCLPMAMAEENGKTAAVLGLSNINVMGQNLGELEVWMGLYANDLPTLLVSAMVGEEVLASGVGQLDGTTVKFMFDGEDKAYGQEVPQLSQYADQMGSFKEIIPALDELVLPLIPGIAIPKLDVASLLSGISSDGKSFTISTEMVDSLLDMASLYGDQLSAQVPQAKQLLDMLPQLKGMLSLSGTVADEGDAQVTRVNLLVQGSEAATLVFSTKENDIRLGLEASGTEQVALNLVSNPDANRYDLTLGAMGQDLGSMSLYQEDGMEKFVFDLSGTGESVGFGFDYGTVDGVDIVKMALSAGQSGSFTLNLNTAKNEEGERTGTLSFEGNGMEISADVVMYLDDDDAGEITWPDSLLPLNEIDPSNALAPVAEYINGLEAAA